MQHHDDSSVGDGPENNDDASSNDDLIEPKLKQKMQKRIFETTNQKLKSDLENIADFADVIDARGPSLRPNS
jgi:hypothetical protein